MSEDQPSHLNFNPPPPRGRRANGIDVGLFLDGLAWDGGELTLPSGMRYRLLVVGETARMSVASLRKIRSLAASGAEVLLGRRPVHPFGLAGHAEGDVAFKRLVVELWDGFSATASSRRFGKGRLWHGVAPEKVLEALNVPFDFEAVGADEIGFTHRRLADRDIYFVANHSSSSEVRRFTGVFRAAGTPEFWDACDGSIQAVEEFAAKDGLTRIPLELPHAGSVFVVFHRDGKTSVRGNAARTFQPRRKPLVRVFDLSSNWNVRFQDGRGAPSGDVSFPALKLFNTCEDMGIRYFSGTASYVKEFDCVPDGRRHFLEVKGVHDVARVFVNGREVAALWSLPYRCEVTPFVKPGTNEIKVEVTSTWFNRLAYDFGQPPEKRKTWTIWKIDGRPPPCLQPGAQLSDSGLLGPVTLHTLKTLNPKL